MSRTTIFAVTPGAGVEELAEFRNAHGAAPVVWGTLTQRVLRKDFYSWGEEVRTGTLWKLWEDPALSEFVRAVLGMTFDYVYIERHHFRRAAEDIRRFFEWAPQNPEHVNHWPALAELFIKHANDPNVPAIAIQQTSVADDLWRGDWNEEKEDYDELDWSNRWSLYEEIDRKQPSEVSRG